VELTSTPLLHAWLAQGEPYLYFTPYNWGLIGDGYINRYRRRVH